MSNEKMKNEMVTLRAKAEKLTKDFNDAYQTSKYDKADKLFEKLTETVNEYTTIAKTVCYNELLETKDPMMAAIKQLEYSTIRAKDTKEGEMEKIRVVVIEDVKRPINLLELHKKAKDGIGADKNWPYMIEKLNMLMTAQKATDLGINPKSINDSYAMSKIAQEINLGKTPTSKTNILKTVQSIVTAMIGDGYKATSHDVNYLLSIYSRKNRKALTVSCANHKFMRTYMAEICHRIVTGKTYEIEYKKTK